MNSQLLSACIRPACEEAEVRAIAGQLLDWHYTLRFARTHGLAPLLFACLRKACPEAVPSAIMQELRLLGQSCAQNGLRYTGELISVCDALEKAGVRVIPFKGPVLAWSLYGSPAVREMSDLDLLVQPADVPLATDALKRAGYTPRMGRADRWFAEWNSEMQFTREGGFDVDLHWQLAPPHFQKWFPLERLSERLQNVQLPGRVVSTLSREDLLRYLCTHAAKHGWGSLYHVADMSYLIAAGVDFDKALEQAKEHGGVRALLLGLALTADLTGTGHTMAIRAALEQHPEIQPLIQTAKAVLLSSDPASKAPTTTSLFWQAKLLERAEDWAGLARSVFQPNMLDCRWLPLPRPLYPLYYLVKPCRLAVKHVVNAAANLSSQ